jgi:hypothetical protein
VILIFARFYSSFFATPIWVVNDVVNYTLSGQVWIGFPFQIEFLEDSDKPPRGKITVENVDTTMGEAVRNLSFSPSLDLTVYASSDWNTVIDVPSNSRLPVGTPTVEYAALALQLWDVTITSQTIEASFGPPDISQEFWPQTRCTQNFTPGLFR